MTDEIERRRRKWQKKEMGWVHSINSTSESKMETTRESQQSEKVKIERER